MLASTKTVPAAPSPVLYFDPLHDDPALDPSGQRALKRHKVLPHPRTRNRHSRGIFPADATSPVGPHAKIEQPSTPPNPKHDDSPTNRAPGPALPPTPPAHSRTSSGNQSIRPASPNHVGSPVRSATNNSASTTPRTPPQQHTSPPTPEVTPPQPERRSRPPRPVLADRFPSRLTADSRTESFTTAPENLDSSEEDDKLSTPRPPLSSSVTSHSIGRRTVDSKQRRAPDVGLGLGLSLDSDDRLTPRTRREFLTFDGEWDSPSNIRQEWDNKYERNVRVEKRRVQPKTNGRKAEVVEDVTVTPTNATKALLSMPLSDRPHTHPSPPPESTNRDKRSTEPSTSGSSVSTDARRSSGMSSKSTVSTVVEAILVGTPPQRQKTLRHVRKQTALRDSNSEISPSSSSANTSLRQAESVRRARPRRAVDRPVDSIVGSESLASTGTANSIASRKARREVWKSGGIPVVVIPDRKASIKAAEPPLLRSTNSRHSKRSNSLSSAPPSSLSKVKDLTPYFNKPSRRGRSMSESDRTAVQVEELTMDYPPIVPIRRSSLSAPTSRNGSRAGSRAGSLTAESLKAHNTLLEQESKRQHQPQPPHVTVEHAPPVEEMSRHPDQRQLQPAPSVESHRDAAHDHKPLVDNNGDPFFGKRLTAHNTPFSQASVETNGTHSAADISEAMAVNIYPHQNKSVLMVHHMSKPVDPATAANAVPGDRPVPAVDATETGKPLDKPRITANGPDGVPVTPPQPQFSMDDVDSPLRNPRAPPEPPSIAFIPATPSGLTPAAEKEKMLGNYFEETEKRPSLVRRAFSLRKSREDARPSGFLLRSLSFTKGIRRDASQNRDLDKDVDAKEMVDDAPADETKLHPFWRPAYEDDEYEDDDWNYDRDNDNYDTRPEVDGVYRYPAADNRPHPRRRSLSDRLRHTFAILPIDDENHYTAPGPRSPERRTVKRTPSGRLRVMKYRDSYSSLDWSSRRSSRDYDSEGRPSTAPDQPYRRAWGIEKRVDDRGRRLFPGWQDKLEQYRPQNLQRRLSEHRRQKRTDALRQKISGPREVRDGVGEVIKRNSYKGPSYQPQTQTESMPNGKTYRQRPDSHQRREVTRA
ncbi:hypothetical protein GGR52DRAFT_116568 [Hypoxylon sp. FL1284]|nr:hypothetical protein GGR52DRAFT_116568 [Hypoxylon sp. FL1284]